MAGLGAVLAEVMVAAAEPDDGLSGGLVQPIGGILRLSTSIARALIQNPLVTYGTTPVDLGRTGTAPVQRGSASARTTAARPRTTSAIGAKSRRSAVSVTSW
jgi:hypothetical protein